MNYKHLNSTYHSVKVITRSIRSILLFITFLILQKIAYASDSLNFNFDTKGHIKYQSLLNYYPDDSLYFNFTNGSAWDNNADIRLSTTTQTNAWSLNIDYQHIILTGDRLSMQRQLPPLGTTASIIPDDQNRYLDLSHTIRDHNKQALYHRLDRLHLNYTGEKIVLRIGRQAVSWGNGLIYNPMDFFNPFDPTSIDKEYKTGDDMIYGQYLLDNGNDIQAIWVNRRDNSGISASNMASTAIKYHTFINTSEIDFLVAKHYNDNIIALGTVFNLADAIVRSDFVSTKTGITQQRINSYIINTSYSWILWDKNMSGTVEYFHNGFGIKEDRYDPAVLANNPSLINRLQRGELYSLAKDYLSASITIEFAPLWQFTSNVFFNLNDDSKLFQLSSFHDLSQNLQLIAAVNIPAGNNGTEFGGIESSIANNYLSTKASLFAQLAWYY